MHLIDLIQLELLVFLSLFSLIRKESEKAKELGNFHSRQNETLKFHPEFLNVFKVFELPEIFIRKLVGCNYHLSLSSRSNLQRAINF